MRNLATPMFPSNQLLSERGGRLSLAVWDEQFLRQLPVIK